MSSDDTVQVQPTDLDSAPSGQELRRVDYVVLAVLGIVIPALLLVWGWM